MTRPRLKWRLDDEPRLNDETATQVDDGVSLSAQRGRAHLSRARYARAVAARSGGQCYSASEVLVTVSISKENGDVIRQNSQSSTLLDSTYDLIYTYTILLLFFALNAPVGARASYGRHRGAALIR